MYISEWRKPWIKKESSVKKRLRAASCVRRLKTAYPNAKMALRYGNEIQLLVAVMLSAQCTDKKVNEVTEKLFKKYKTAKDFATADRRTLEQEIRSTGFYHSKARSIREACRTIVEKFGGNVPRAMGDMLQLRGVARKTANVVLGNAFRVVDGIAVDTHVRRLSQRLGYTKSDNPEKIEQDLMALIDRKDWFMLTYFLIEHGRRVCNARRPGCSACVLQDLCPSSRL